MASPSSGGRAFGRLLLATVALACSLTTGCVTLPALCPDKPPTGPVAWAAARWQNEVARTQDPANGGNLLRGLAGRLYLFPAEGKFPQIAEGDLIVDLYDDRPVATGGAPIALERWQFPKEVIEQLVRKDAIGWGFTVFLPWVNTYNPDISTVHVQLCFLPKNGGTPIYESSGQITLVHGERQFLYSSTQVLGKGPRPAAQPPITPASALAPRPKATPAPAQAPIQQTAARATVQPPIQLPGQEIPIRPAPKPAPAQVPQTPPPAPTPRPAPEAPKAIPTPQPAAEAPAHVHILGGFSTQATPTAVEGPALPAEAPAPPAGAWLGQAK